MVQLRDQTLEAVIAHQQISLLFQPQIDPRTGAIVGAEALARWAGAATPEALFKRAAGAGLSERLSRLVQRKALQAAASWEGSLKNLHVSINLLPQDLARSGYAKWLLDEIAQAGIHPNRITVEITESALLSDSQAIAKR
ncbi:MAG: EAL domain-containing protein, partial [Sphingomicrobium sp.]